MFTVALAQARTVPTWLPSYQACSQRRCKSTLSAINRSLAQSSDYPSLTRSTGQDWFGHVQRTPRDERRTKSASSNDQNQFGEKPSWPRRLRLQSEHTLPAREQPKDRRFGKDRRVQESVPDSTSRTRKERRDSLGKIVKPRAQDHTSLTAPSNAEESVLPDHVFTRENLDRIIKDVADAEEAYKGQLPTRPDHIPVFDNPSDTVVTKRALSKAYHETYVRAAQSTPALKEWTRVAKHLYQIYRTAWNRSFTIPGRPWVTDDDPHSARVVWHHFLQTRFGGDFHSNPLSPLGKRELKIIYRTYIEQALPHIKATGKFPDSITKVSDTRITDSSPKLFNTNAYETPRSSAESSKVFDTSKSPSRQQKPTIRTDRSAEVTINGNENNQSHRHSGNDDVYVSIPYTTASSEFIYGTNVVVAALKAQRRKLYNLYIHERARSAATDIVALAKKAEVKYTYVDNDFLPKMDKMAQGRPHNGVILETSPVPTLPVETLGKISRTSSDISISLLPQSREERDLNGSPNSIPSRARSTWRQPIVLMLDGILDPGNLGNIIRTAYFYGVDAVAICVNTCASFNLSSVQKAASGAAEAVTILSVQFPAKFVTESVRNGWKVHAAVAPESPSGNLSKGKRPKQLFTENMTSPLANEPSILMLGAEGEGLRQNLMAKANYNVSIGGRETSSDISIGVESLNVSTAAAVLLEAYMKRPPNVEGLIEKSTGDLQDKIM